MWQCKYAKEPFDLKLFVLHMMKMVKWIILSAVMGAVCIGGIYYLKNVTFGGRVPYIVTKKLDVEYAVNPETGTEYSYYVAYTWNDWIKSDVFLEGLLEGIPIGMTKEEMLCYYEMTLPADTRNPYLVVTHPDERKAALLSDILTAGLLTFAEEQKEIKEITVIDTVGPVLEVRDIRTFRAAVLGAVMGTFFALFVIAFQLILGEGIFVPETFTYRYQLPVVGYIDRAGGCSCEVKTGIAYLFRDKEKVGITAVEPELDLMKGKSLLGNKQAVCLPSVLQVPESLEYLRENDGNLLLVKAGCSNGKTIESVLYLCQMHDVKITAALLVDADGQLIEAYRFRLHRKKDGHCKDGE